MGDDPRWASEVFFARTMRARLASEEERRDAGARYPRAYVLPDGRVVTPRQLRKLAGRILSESRFPNQDLRSRLFMALRFRAWKEGRPIEEVWEDPEFRERWRYVLQARRTRTRQRQVRIARAWELLDIIEPSIDGGWDYTDEFLAWLAAGGPQ